MFVARVAPLDVIDAEIDRTARVARGRVLSIVEPGAGRVEPACPIVLECGGCDWMHLSAETQRAAHAAMVSELLGRIREVRWPQVVAHPASALLAYRRRARLSIESRGGVVRVGYRAPRSTRVVDVAACAVLSSPIAGVPGALRGLLANARGEGEAQVAVGLEGRPVVEVRFRGELPSSYWQRLDGLVRDGTWSGARTWVEGATSPASFGDPRTVVAGADGAPLVSAAGSFSQPSEESARELAERVRALAKGTGRHVVELFAGSGALSVLLAREAASFVGVEQDEAAVVAARENLRARALDAKMVAADAESYRLPKRTEVVVLDPPRTGAKGAAREIASVRPKRVVYVSCDPATLARDVEVLVRAAYAPIAVETFELFPQTSHVETVVLLER